MISLVLIILCSYLVGSIPTAIWTSRIVMKDDVRNHGSKNAGATNVFRVMGWKPALIVVLVDMAKGVLAVLLIAKIRLDSVPLNNASFIQILAGIAAIFGHIWTVFAGFKGGKGVGTAFGVLVALIPVPALIALGLWIVLVWLTRIVSVSSMIAAVSLPVSILVQRALGVTVPNVLLCIALIVAALIVFTHRSNIGRLIRGEENRFGSRSTNEDNDI
ncbi:glycerol-3-phosphate 1-O-acyltransferase PlsY [bacterium]|nr:glycerol-3-phosphate 1-O-acyltransferase PlsY [bacterium]RQV97947.1 MAG: glycerol-3-phosphate 1-O-acyltransferase [bacterium]